MTPLKVTDMKDIFVQSEVWDWKQIIEYYLKEDWDGYTDFGLINVIK